MTIRFLNKGDNTAEIFLYGEVGPKFWGDEVSAKDFAEELKALGGVNKIDLRINSYGGDVFEGFAIHRQLMDHGAEITTHVDGVAASIASVIAMAGKNILISESGMMMIHDPWTIAMGNATDFRSIAERLDATGAAIAAVYVARSGKDEKQIRAWMSEEKEFFGQAAVDAGLADGVAENLRLAARAKPSWEELRAMLTRRQNAGGEGRIKHPHNAQPAPTPALDAKRKELNARRQRLAMVKQASGAA